MRSPKGLILDLLRRAGDGVVSGELLSEALGMSRVSVWKHVQKLQSLGYVITGTAKGYHLDESDGVAADVLHAWEFPDREDRIFFFPEVESTMDLARDLARNGAPALTVVTADRQTKGRGRLARHWDSLDGGLYFTMITRPDLPVARSFLVNFAASLTLTDVVNDLFDVGARVKWPNDILAGERKLCGMLSEMEADGGMVSFVNVGMGLNVRNVPGPAAPDAVSLRELTDRDLSRRRILSAFLDAFESLSARIEAVDILALWKSRTITIGRRVRVVTLRDAVEGLAVDVADDGGLMVRLDGGEVRKVVYGDCFLAPQPPTGYPSQSPPPGHPSPQPPPPEGEGENEREAS